ncbi:hypothetical protein [Amaricoccus sp.]|uniref:hypothetical protein n=1 Tax=Amaricoccus sp. TaxID=1872485 RepID=UPI00260606C2|nr:hypothetical protein [Amaricoccus sp.]HRO10539.1 hypothetical protein [Amaricoccus sp.]
MRRVAAAAIGAFLAVASPAEAEVVCRPNTLGTVSCPAAEPRPLARPGPAPTQALDRVRAREKQPEGETFIPARRTNRLGGTVLREGGGPAGTCRPDTLGNLHCR